MSAASPSADPYSSAILFGGWSTPVRLGWSPISPGDPLVSDPKSWLMRVGWKKHGLVDPLPRA